MAEVHKLTKAFIDGIRPGERDAIYWDTETKGFGLKVTPKGRMVFVVMHRPKGHVGAAKKYTIGKFGEFTVQKARDRAQEVLLEGRKGHDLGARERAEKHRSVTDRIDSLAVDFLAKHASQNRTHKETKRILEREMLPAIGKRSIHDITKHDVIGIVERVAERGSMTMANRTLATVRKFFNWCLSRGVIDSSPAHRVAAPFKEKSRDRVLNDTEIGSVMKAAHEIGYPFGAIVQLLFMTAQRRDEVAGMRWSEINLDKGEWNIPGERAKNRKAHTVHLSSEAISLIAALPRFPKSDGSINDLVFTTTGRSPVSGFSKSKAQIDKLSDAEDWRLHDIRRTVVTHMSQLGIAHHVADAILNHKSGVISGVAAVYQRNQFLMERREAIEKWNDRLSDLAGDLRN
jgi:integrase